MADLDSTSELLQWDRHGLLSRPVHIAAQPLHQLTAEWEDRLPVAATAAVHNGAPLIVELPPELQGIGAVATALTAELTGLRPVLWQRDQPVPPPTGPAVWLTALPASYAATNSTCVALPSAHPLEIGDQVRFVDHPSLTLAHLLALFARFCPPIAAHRLTSTVPAVWPENCTSEVPIRINPAKQLAVQLNDRIPIYWGSHVISGVAADWCARRLWYAGSMAFTASQPDLARLYSLGRLPRYWPNVAALVRLPTFSANPLDDAIQKIFARRRFPVFDLHAPPGLSILEATYYLLGLGEWAALYTAALTDSDPCEQTPLLILFGDEGPRS